MTTWLFNTSAAKHSGPATALRVNQSVQGVPISLFLGGQNRMSGTLVWYGDFAAAAATTGKGKGQGGANYTYSASFIDVLCEGLINSVLKVWINKSKYAWAAQPWLTFFTGSFSQAAWSYMTSRHAAQALTYRGLAYVAGPNFPLGTSPELQQLSFEVLHSNNGAIPGQPDADPRVCTADFLTNQFYGVGFPSSKLGTGAQWSSYAKAVGLIVSPVVASQTNAQQFVKDILQATHTEARWSNGILDFVPYGDTAISLGQQTNITETHVIPALAAGQSDSPVPVGFASTFVRNISVVYSGGGAPLTQAASSFQPGQALAAGVFGLIAKTGTYYFSASDVGNSVDITYTYAAAAAYNPDNTVWYGLTVNNFLAVQGASSSSGGKKPVVITRKPRAEMINAVKVEYLDRVNDYNPAIVEAQDEASINAFPIGKRAGSVRSHHFFCLASAARISAALQLQREMVPRTYQITVGRRFIMLDVMDLVNLTEPSVGLSNKTVRIIGIDENSDRTLTMTAEDFTGTASAPVYNIQPLQGANNNYNIDPGSLNQPIFVEPPDALGNGLNLWIGLSGVNIAVWGGCDVYMSVDGGQNYTLQGNFRGPSTMGVLSAQLPGVSPNPAGGGGAVSDITNTLQVDLTQSGGSLTGTNSPGAQAGSTVSYVDGEILSFQNTSLISASKYNLTNLLRGEYGSSPSNTHAIGSKFLYLANGVYFALPFNQNLIGTTVYFKFVSFNQWGGGRQQLGNVGAYQYTILGSALTSPLPNVQNFISNYVGSITYLDWDIINDFRTPVVYEIRKGSAWANAQVVGTYAHPHVPVIGDDNYLIEAKVTPITGVTVYSASATSLNVTGSAISALPNNLLASYDESSAGENWSGTIAGDIYTDGTNLLTVPGTPIPAGTVCLLHMNGKNGGTLFTDSVNGHVFTPTNAVTDTSQFEFSPSSAHFTNAGSNNFLAGDGSADFAFGAGAFTIDFWVRFNVLGTHAEYLYDQRPSATDGAYPTIFVTTGGALTYLTNSTNQINGTSTIVINTWYHIALTRDGSGNTRLFLNGSQEGSTFSGDTTSYLNGASRPVIGGNGNTPSGLQDIDGWIDELRVVKGSALWTANFTVPAAPVSSGKGTYTIGHTVNEQRLAPCLVQCSFTAQAQSVSADVFNPGPPNNLDVFDGHTDFFQTASNAFMAGTQPQISISTDGSTFGPYVKWALGVYALWKINAQIAVVCTSPQTLQTVVTSFKEIVYAPTRTDHPIVNGSIAAAGQVVTFAPDGGTAAPFNGGPNGGTTSPGAGQIIPAASVPGIQVALSGAVAGDHVLATGLSLSQVTLQGKDNANANKALTGTVQVWGF